MLFDPPIEEGGQRQGRGWACLTPLSSVGTEAQSQLSSLGSGMASPFLGDHDLKTLFCPWCRGLDHQGQASVGDCGLNPS